ncbi:alpha/beta fold hydrolase [Lysobacter enzymogenes]|uniref:thioesterase domain-containing protein n=1 Tax=Lysobacter enzymogenes TaxID=69 RepID=UPI003D2F7397
MDDAYLAPRDAMERSLCRIWEDLLKISPVGVRDDFFDLGGHSLLAVRLMAQIEKALGRALPLAALFEGATVEKLAARLGETIAPPPGPLVAIQPEGSGRPLFFVHPAGGNVLCYADLAKRLGGQRPFYGLQSSFSDPAAPLDRIEDMAARYLDAILAVQPAGPYLLGGWSMGAIVAYEIAQQLLRRGQQVALLALLDHRVPRRGDADEALDEIALMRRFFDGAVEFDPAEVEAMGAERRLDWFLRTAQRSNLISPDIEPAQVRAYLRVYLANLQALGRYAAQSYRGRITLLRTANESTETDRTLGWQALTDDGVDVFDVPGRHHELVLEPHAATVARILQDCLLRADPVASPTTDKTL